MKIKRRTEVTIVTHEITLLRIQNEVGDDRFDVVLTNESLRATDDLPSEEDGEGEEHEAEKNDR